MYLTGLGGSGASRVPAQHPPPSPVPAPAAHGACLGQMPAGSNRERPKLFGSCEEEEPVLFPAHPPSPSIPFHRPRRGAEAAGPVALCAPRSGVGIAGKVTDRGALRDGEGVYLSLGRAGGSAAAPPSLFRARGAFRAGWRSRGALRGAPRRDAPPRGGTHGGAAAPQPAGTRCGAPRDAVRSSPGRGAEPAGRPSLPAAARSRSAPRAPAATTPEGC